MCPAPARHFCVDCLIQSSRQPSQLSSILPLTTQKAETHYTEVTCPRSHRTIQLGFETKRWSWDFSPGLPGFPNQCVHLWPLPGSQAPGGEFHEGQGYTFLSSTFLEGSAHSRCLLLAGGMNASLSRGVQISAKLGAFGREGLPTWKQLYLDPAIQALKGIYRVPTVCQALCEDLWIQKLKNYICPLPKRKSLFSWRDRHIKQMKLVVLWK